MVWFALLTTSVKAWVAFGNTPLAAVRVSGKLPATPGVPARTPVAGVNVTPDGSAPEIDSVGVGVPVAVTVNVPATPFVNVVVFALVMVGGTGVGVGVTGTVPDAAPGPTELVALTEQVYGVSLVRPVTTIGDVAPLPVTPPGLHVAV
jgi:hypothetical protein